MTAEVLAPQTGGSSRPTRRRSRLRPLVLGVITALGVRVLELAGFLVLLVTALFFLIRVENDPAVALAGPEASQSEVAAIKALYGFDRPLIVQYWNFLLRFFLLRFGDSVQEQRPALGVVIGPVGTTVLLCLLATVLNLLVAIPVGVYLGRGGGCTATHWLVRTAVLLAQGIQFYIVAVALILFLAVRNHIFPATGTSGLSSWVLPAVALAWLAAPRLIRIIATASDEVWRSETVVGARAYGLPDRTIKYRYVLPNVLLPLISTVSTQFTLLLSGAVIIEELFGIHGVGQLLVRAVQNGDFPELSASVTAIGVVVFIVTTVSDIGYRVADPRLRRSA